MITIVKIIMMIITMIKFFKIIVIKTMIKIFTISVMKTTIKCSHKSCHHSSTNCPHHHDHNQVRGAGRLASRLLGDLPSLGLEHVSTFRLTSSCW